jgi:hypothetical protein
MVRVSYIHRRELSETEEAKKEKKRTAGSQQNVRKG